MNRLQQLLITLSAVLVLAACGSSPTIMDGSSGDEAGGAVTQGTGSDGGYNSGSSSSGSSGTYAAGSLATVFYFDYDRSTLTFETRQALDLHAANLKASSRSIRLEGHGDDRGTREYNLALGERRAKSIGDYLVLQGVSRGQIETISYGEEKPVAFSQNEESYRLNRRVELK